ncbi:MAG: hypothetical protein ACI3YK_06475 [Eubacteriales bacterium]
MRKYEVVLTKQKAKSLNGLHLQSNIRTKAKDIPNLSSRLYEKMGA